MTEIKFKVGDRIQRWVHPRARTHSEDTFMLDGTWIVTAYPHSDHVRSYLWLYSIRSEVSDKETVVEIEWAATHCKLSG